MKRIHSSWVAAGFIAASVFAHAQNPIGANVEVFGEDPIDGRRAPDVVKPAANLLLNLLGGRRAVSSSASKAPKVEGMEHTLLFSDGRQMRGRLVEITQNEVVWSRMDASQPFRFGKGDVRQILLKRTDSNSEQGIAISGASSSNKSAPTSMATLRLGGTDWLHGEVASADGQVFSVKAGSASFSVAREQIEWMFFGKEPAAAFGLDISNAETWVTSGGGAEDMKDGRLRFSKGAFIAKSINLPKRFEMAFEIPVEKDGNPSDIKMWLQPFTPRPNSYSTGTVELSITESEMERCIYENGFKRDKLKFPADAPAAKDGWHSMRVFYDGVDRKMTVHRNGAKVAEWALADEKANNREALRGICFSRDGNREIVIGNLRFAPWDGDISAIGKAVEGDRLSLPGTPSEFGKTTAIAEKKITFAGAEKELVSGAMLKLSGAGKGVSGADALLVLGRHGELSVGGLEMRDGKAKCRAGFAPELELDAALLSIITFPPKNNEAVVSDVLVFKNADELPGKLVEATNGGVLKWKMPAGLEVEIQPEHVAGVRFDVKPAPPTPKRNVVRSFTRDELKKEDKKEEEAKKPQHSTLELRNGDRIAGEMVAVGKDSLRFKHAVAGEREVAGAQAWSFYTSPVFDGASSWGADDPDSSQRRATTADRWITLDGAFFTRAALRSDSQSDSAYLTQTGLALPSRYEIRCVARSLGNGEPYITIMLGSKNGSNQLNFSFSYGELNIHGYSQRGNGRSFSTEVPLRDKFGQSSIRNVRLLVDSENGTVAVMMDGVLLKKLGSRKEDTFVNLGHTISFSTYSGHGATKLSNFWIGPWSGEVPGVADGGSISLANGDVALGKVLGLSDEKMKVETEVGEFDLPVERVSGIEFGGVPSPAKAAGRIRLKDGSIFHVDEFKWEAASLSAKSAVLGDLKFAAVDVAELILKPSPIRFPSAPLPSKAEKKADPADAAAPAVPLEPSEVLIPK